MSRDGLRSAVTACAVAGLGCLAAVVAARTGLLGAEAGGNDRSCEADPSAWAQNPSPP